MLSDISTVIVSISALVASGAAVYGVKAWKAEHIGKRKIDLAEEVLALFYEAKGVIESCRSQLGFVGEGSTRRPREKETPDQKAARDQAYVLIERLQKRHDLFARLHSLRYRFMAQNGTDSAKPFDELRDIRNQLIGASHQLSEAWSRPSMTTLTASERNRMNKPVEHALMVSGSCAPEHDLIALDVDRIVSNIENICREIIGRK